MGDPAKPPSHSSLDPTAASFTMPEQAAPLLSTNSATPSVPFTNGEAKPHEQSNESKKGPVSAPKTSGTNVGTGAQMAEAELKKQKALAAKAQKAAEKAARRAEKVAEKGATVQIAGKPQSTTSSKPNIQRRPSTGKKEGEILHKRTGSTSKPMPIRPAGSTPETKEKPKDEKRLDMVSHLFVGEKRTTIAGAGREIHPAILALGLQLRDYVICGANARCAAMLLAFKKVIQAYTTPPGTALSRHLTTHLSHQISYLKHSRSLSVSQGNSIRWLKLMISSLDPDLSDSSAKEYLCRSIDQFIREKIILADKMIEEAATARIADGDVILTFGKSSIVEKTLLGAHRQAKKFKVVVVDSRPLFEGKNLARSLSSAGMEVQYSLLSGLPDVVKSVTKCFLGASAMLGDGRLYSRAGSAMVAMMAKNADAEIPVIVLCEHLKFTSRVALNSLDMSELGSEEVLVEHEQSDTLTVLSAPAPAKGGKKGGKDDESEESRQKKGLEGWKEQSNLYLLNLMYDVTPAQYLDVVIMEMGSMPPSAVSTVIGVHGEDE